MKVGKRNRALDIIRKKGFDFGFDPGACQKCPGNCCCGESGNVWVSQEEILLICDFLGINTIDFMKNYVNRIGSRLSIKERFTGHDYECIFFNGNARNCSIYAVRPVQCRQFPFWEYFKRHRDQVIKECPGIRE